MDESKGWALFAERVGIALIILASIFVIQKCADVFDRSAVREREKEVERAHQCAELCGIGLVKSFNWAGCSCYSTNETK